MNEDMHAQIAHVASAIADKTRAKMLCLLMDGRAYTATELTTVADIAPSTASVHLTKLVDSGLIKRLKQGRFHYFCLADQHVSRALEMLMNLSQRSEIKNIKSSTPAHLKCARTCYQHMAGEVAVQLRHFFLQQKWLTGSDIYLLTPEGENNFQQLGIDISALKSAAVVRDCLDWSERKPHFAGPLANQLLLLFEHKDWLYRYPQSRQLFWTEKGKQNLAKYFAITRIDDL